MTTHDKDKIIAAARMVCAKIDMHGPDERDDIISMHPDKLTHFYAIAFEDGRQAEREAQANHIQPCGNCGRDLSNEIRARSTK